MNCTTCFNKVCRKQQISCNRENFNKSEIINQYLDVSTSAIVQAAAELVDFDRAGQLSRLDEIIEYATRVKYKRLGVAYCYGMEQHVRILESMLIERGFTVAAVSCSVGGLKQSEVNSESCIHKVSCNPLGQAQQLNSENVGLTLIVGICMGHDILLNRNLNMDFTTYVVKDRLHNHSPLKGLRA
jgi:uncharacterized metal-binding protein